MSSSGADHSSIHWTWLDDVQLERLRVGEQGLDDIPFRIGEDHLTTDGLNVHRQCGFLVRAGDRSLNPETADECIGLNKVGQQLRRDSISRFEHARPIGQTAGTRPGRPWTGPFERGGCCAARRSTPQRRAIGPAAATPRGSEFQTGRGKAGSRPRRRCSSVRPAATDPEQVPPPGGEFRRSWLAAPTRSCRHPWRRPPNDGRISANWKMRPRPRLSGQPSVIRGHRHRRSQQPRPGPANPTRITTHDDENEDPVATIRSLNTVGHRLYSSWVLTRLVRIRSFAGSLFQYGQTRPSTQVDGHPGDGFHRFLTLRTRDRPLR